MMREELHEQIIQSCNRLIDEAAGLVGPYDPDQIIVFARRLSGLGSLTCPQLLEQFKDVTVPGDFRHVRFTNLTTNWRWGGFFSSRQQPLEIERIILHIFIGARRDDVTPSGYGTWVETVALPIKNLGVLELGLRFEPLN